MVGEATSEKKLYDAATIGDVATFQQVLQQHPHLVDAVSFPCLKNVLHIAIKHGHESLVQEVLRINKELARDVDSKKSSSLHIAAAQGNVEIGKKLLAIAPEMCWWLDDQGMNPVHVAATKGRVDILEEMLRLDLFPAMEKVHRGQTVLHLCVKHRQLRALIVLVEKFGELANVKDDDGETLLHLAVRSNQLEMLRYLVKSKKIKKREANSMGKTPLDILLDESPPREPRTFTENRTLLVRLPHNSESGAGGLPKLTDIAMVVVVLIATMAFQAGFSPPGGVWQDDTSSHSAGKAVMASTDPTIYMHFIRASTTAFVSSLVTIFLITTGMTVENVFSLQIATVAMWVALASIGVSYGASLIMTNPKEKQTIGRIVAIEVSLFAGIFVLIYIYFLRALKRKDPSEENLTIDELISRASQPVPPQLFV